MAMTASPSTTWPFSSITITRSASPSRAMPIWALRFRTSAHALSGWSAPTPSLMFTPSGETPMAVTSAPSSSNTRGATRYAAPWAASTTTRIPSSDRSRGKVFFTKTT